MKFTLSIFLLFLFIGISSCSNDDGRSCITCNSAQTASFELCKESNGNASVNGEDTGTNYDTYFEGLSAAGTNCGG